MDVSKSTISPVGGNVVNIEYHIFRFGNFVGIVNFISFNMTTIEVVVNSSLRLDRLEALLNFITLQSVR